MLHIQVLNFMASQTWARFTFLALISALLYKEAVNLEDKRRSGPRSVICLPVSVKFSTEEAPRPVHLRDMSATGISIFSDFSGLNPSTRIEVIVSVPYEISLTEEIQVRLGGQVMRVDNDSQDRRSIAAALFPIPALGHA